ncbi:Alcohol dehydrogenase, zinc-binding protein [Rubrobacter xylanophilus DSM 9941]|uniref:Alcohol dehydrogenase, zinc-binding protein n=1 Tax=Rubrobacter xylanophilus (strain DSM 9941 / JCM 11954 / NBRC 16129 / PRD-1) TaxID=266117 RepID=Q1AXH5_RUBXD|nr:NADPH:quinone oxidoreductase family protein [Rubrobacter xylanophilus]ABG03903.1 Alcohol dehydrogenase, zinc-binding protein [Rubrobacter xylanophilus DSM 9941]
MRAWRVHENGEPERVLRLEEVEEPSCGPGEALIEVEAASLNFLDVLLCRGGYQERPEPPFIPGAEAAGRVLEAGPQTGLEPGGRVVALTRPRGAFAERVAVPATGLFPVPEEMPPEKAAALPIVYQTAHFALHRRAGLEAGETVLVHAGAGGVGSAAIQLARAAGARVIATAGSEEKLRICRGLGAELALDYRRQDVIGAVKEATGGRGADVVFDPVGGDVFDASRRCVAFEGRLLVIGFAGGRIAEAPTNHVLLKNYSVVGVHWGLYQSVMPELVREVHEELLGLYASGEIDPLIGEAVPFEELPAALARLGAGRTVGKVVARVGS